VARVGLRDEVRGLVECVGELDERGTVRLARDGARREAAVLPQDPPRAAEGVERGVGGGGGGAVVADGVVELDVGRGVVDDDGGVEAEVGVLDGGGAAEGECARAGDAASAIGAENPASTVTKVLASIARRV
jgi:hypothetical protein